MDYEKATKHFKEEQIMYSQPLATTTLEKALQYPVNFETKIPAQLGLHSIGKSNEAEGVVIKPAKKQICYCCKSKGGTQNFRFIVKNKNPKFEEVVHSFQQSKKKGLSDRQSVAVEISKYINKNRFLR